MKSSGGMESSQIWGFSKILSKSIKLVFKNGKSIAAITTLSILPSSFLFLLFCYFYQTTMDYITYSIINSTSANNIFLLQIIILFPLIFSFELGIIYAIIAIAQAAGIATILETVTSYNTSDTKLSLQDLFPMVKTKWSSPFTKKNSSGSLSRNYLMTYFACMVAVSVVVPLVMFNPNPIAIAILGVTGVSLLVFQLYASVPGVLAAVILVVEDGGEAAERAEKLVQGQRVHGFMLNLLLNVMGLIALWGLWMIVGDERSFPLNFAVYGVFLFTYSLLTRIFGSVLYTVYYFQCKEYHGEDMNLLSVNFNYSPLLHDIP